jgi:Uma2 family endonuclease
MVVAQPLKPVALPNQEQLPCDDGEPMETQRHKMQMDLLIEVLYPWLEQRDNGYVGGNMFVYYSSQQLKNQDFRGPDFFAVLDVPKGERKSWVVWDEGKAPDVIIELLSESTAQQDKTIKKLIYQNQLRIPEYFWYDPFAPDDWQGCQLVGGSYQALNLIKDHYYVSEKLNLALVRWSGDYEGVKAVWLRWVTLDGKLLPTKSERLRQAEDRAEQAQAQAEKLAAKLREMGINPDNL